MKGSDLALRDLARGRMPGSVRRHALNLRDRFGRLTGGLRVLPDFLLIGAMRAGTSSMYRYLGDHPQVIRSARKEVEYLGFRFDEGEAWYRGHFPTRARVAWHRSRHGRCVTFEASPSSMAHPQAAGRARALLPEARMVAVLRDPVERAWSHHRHLRRIGIEQDSFEDALRREREVLPDGIAGIGEVGPDEWSKLVGRNAYLGLGMYAEQLARWTDRYPADRLLVVFYEELFADPAAELGRVLDFLGLDPWVPDEFRNWSYARRAAPGDETMDPATRERLTDEMSEPDRQLATMLGRGLPWRS